VLFSPTRAHEIDKVVEGIRSDAAPYRELPRRPQMSGTPFGAGLERAEAELATRQLRLGINTAVEGPMQETHTPQVLEAMQQVHGLNYRGVQETLAQIEQECIDKHWRHFINNDPNDLVAVDAEITRLDEMDKSSKVSQLRHRLRELDPTHEAAVSPDAKREFVPANELAEVKALRLQMSSTGHQTKLPSPQRQVVSNSRIDRLRSKLREVEGKEQPTPAASKLTARSFSVATALDEASKEVTSGSSWQQQILDGCTEERREVYSKTRETYKQRKEELSKDTKLSLMHDKVQEEIRDMTRALPGTKPGETYDDAATAQNISNLQNELLRLTTAGQDGWHESFLNKKEQATEKAADNRSEMLKLAKQMAAQEHAAGSPWQKQERILAKEPMRQVQLSQKSVDRVVSRMSLGALDTITAEGLTPYVTTSRMAEQA